MDIGEQMVGGLHKGVQNMGGIGVNVPQVSGSRSMPSLGFAGANGRGGNGGNTYQNTFVLPEGTTRQQAREINRLMAEESKRRGARATK
jgi:hypothetical protein